MIGDEAGRAIEAFYVSLCAGSSEPLATSIALRLYALAALCVGCCLPLACALDYTRGAACFVVALGARALALAVTNFLAFTKGSATDGAAFLILLHGWFALHVICLSTSWICPLC